MSYCVSSHLLVSAVWFHCVVTKEHVFGLFTWEIWFPSMSGWEMDQQAVLVPLVVSVGVMDSQLDTDVTIDMDS